MSYFTPPTVAKRYGVSVNKILDLIRLGEIEAFDVANRGSRRPRFRISAEALERFELARSSRPTPKPSRKRKATAGKDYFANL
jgi:hypothetical protein